MRALTFSIEVITLPVSDVDRALRFYVDQVGFAPGLDPTRGDYASFANFSDSDGDSWVLQERGYRNADVAGKGAVAGINAK